MTKTKNKALSVILAACIVGGAAGTALCGLSEPVQTNALSTSTQMTYPFATGTNAFKYAPTFTGVSSMGGDHWEFIQVVFDNGQYNFTDVEYVAIQMKVNSGNFGFTVGTLDNANNERYMSLTNDNKLYFLSESGTMQELSMLNTEVRFSQGMCGTLLLPMNQLGWQWNTGDFTKINSVYFTHNTLYHAGWEIQIGEVGVYKGEPETTSMIKLVDLSNGERARGTYIVDSSNPDCMKMPSDLEVPEPVAPTLASYPFRTGDDMLYYTGDWKGPTVNDSTDNWQTLTVKFDTATVDLSSATYLAVQYNGKVGAPGITFGLQNKDARYSVGAGAADGKPVYFAESGKTASVKVANITNGAVTASSATGKIGAMLIPMDSMAWQFGSAANKTLASIESLVLTTNSRYNYNFEIVVGEVGYYTGTAENPGAFHKILTLNEETDKFSVTSDSAANRGTLSIITPDTPDRNRIGDVTVDWTAEGMKESSFTNATPTGSMDGSGNPIYEYELGGAKTGIWTGGSFGKRELTTDTYGDEALKLTALGTNQYGDGYVAFDLAPAGGFTWAEMKGVSFWARNDSDIEISFNIEVDCKIPVDGKTISDRFNVKQGNRFYLYDVNTGKTSIYMTRPCATVPVGFEGWVWVPFTAFGRADWSNNGVPLELFMGPDSMVTYLALTVHAATYTNKPFSVNKFGAYSTTPSFTSAFVNANGKSIPELMGFTNKEDN